MHSGALVGLLLGAVAAGCGFHTSSGTSADAGALGDGAPPGGESCVSFATLLALDTCQLAFDGELVIQSGDAVYDTSTHVLAVGGASVPVTHATVGIGGDMVEVISAHSVTVASSTRLHVVGSLPLVIAASSDIVVSVDAQIDVSDGGAGAQTSCVDGASPGAADSGGGAGGGGGGYGAEGGKGGDGDLDGSRSAGGGKGLAVAVPAVLRGGCPGAAGGMGKISGGAGGKAGGALYLVAAGRIELQQTAVLNAGGGGGAGGPHTGGAGDTGGGGGAAGGMLMLEAPHIIGPSATIAANGGGGGGGGDSGVAGESGAPGTLTDARASGGRGTSSIFTAGSGIDGGKGGSRPSPAGEDVTAVNWGGGGGGGGSVGIVRIKSADAQLGVISPDPR